MLELAYYEIFKGLITTMATSSVSTGVKLAIERYFGKEAKAPLTVEEEQYPIVSIPLAIGYYYNFIEKIEDQLGGGNFVTNRHYNVQGTQVFDRMGLSDEQKGKLTPSELRQLGDKEMELTDYLGTFGVDDVSVEIVFPKNLSNQALRDCSNYLRRETNKGSIPTAAAGRPYAINYADLDAARPSTLKIIDYARPIEAIPKFYEQVKHVGGVFDDQALWEEIQNREMQAFLLTLRNMIRHHARYLGDKVYFRPYESLAGATVKA